MSVMDELIDALVAAAPLERGTLVAGIPTAEVDAVLWALLARTDPTGIARWDAGVPRRGEPHVPAASLRIGGSLNDG